MSIRVASEAPFFEEWRATQPQSRESTINIANLLLPDPVDIGEFTPTSLSREADVDWRLPGGLIKELILPEHTPVGVVLRTLSDIAKQDILIDEGVDQRVHASFKDVRWAAAFKSILVASDLCYKWEGDTIRVMPLADSQREVPPRSAIVASW